MFVRYSRHAAFVAAIMLSSSIASAVSSWTGSSGIDNNWNTPTNWSGGAPGANADVIFPAASVTSSNNNIVSLQLNSLTITVSNYALTGNAITLGSATPGSGSITLNASAANNSAAFDIALGGAAANSQFFTINTGAALTLGGQLSGSTGVALHKQGAGTLILTGDNSGFTGPFVIDAGIVKIQHASALGATAAAATVITNSQLQLNNVAGSIAKSLSLNGSGPSGNGALLNLAGANTLSGGITLDTDTTIGATAGTLALNGLIADSGAGHNLTIAGGGVIILGAAGGNSYRGTTTINGGVLAISNSSGSATGTGAVVINNLGTLRGNGAVSGAVSLNSGGVLDPGLLSGGGMSTGAVTWNGGGAMAMHLGVDAAGSDRLITSGSLLKGTAGAFQFSFDPAGAVPGEVYDLIQFTSTTFVPGDFSFVSSNPLLAGTFSFDSVNTPTELRFTVTAVPEPATGAVLAIGVVLLSRRRKRSC